MVMMEGMRETHDDGEHGGLRAAVKVHEAKIGLHGSAESVGSARSLSGLELRSR